jgi:serine phosphatase RsbU (regulator of sigma subunit)
MDPRHGWPVDGRPIAVAGATRPYPGETVNGDAWTVDWHQGVCRIAVIDGLGHGTLAAAAAELAVANLTAQPELNPESALWACHRALIGSRGAVMSIAQIDVAAGRLIYAGVGNVEAQLWQSERRQRLIAYRGVLGGSLPVKIRAFTFDLGMDWCLLIYTDGIRDRFERDGLAPPEPPSAQSWADALVAQWARETDDATLVVACSVVHSAGGDPW